MTSHHIDAPGPSSNAGLASSFHTGGDLHRAAVNGDRSTLERLLKQCDLEDDSCDVNEGDKYGRTALVYTVFGDCFDCAELLLRNQANVRQEDHDKRTPLHWAAYLGRPKFINLFLRYVEKNVDWNSGDVDGRTPLHYAAAQESSKCLRLLLKRVLPDKLDVTDSETKTALHWSVYYGNLEHVKLLMAESAKASLRDSNGSSLLHLAAARSSSDSLRTVRFLLKKNSYYATHKDRQGRSPLHLAVVNENEELVKELSLPQVCGLNDQDNLSRSALHYAVLRNNTNIVNILISSGASVYKEDTLGATALHYAAKNNNTAVVDCFLSDNKKLEDIPDKEGRTALIWAASEGSKDVLTLMLANPSHFNVHASDKQGLTALHYACLRGNECCVELLIANSADVSQPDKLGQTALFKACQQGYLNIIDILMKNNTDYLANMSALAGRSGTTMDEQGWSGNVTACSECTWEDLECDDDGNNSRNFGVGRRFSKIEEDENEFDANVTLSERSEWTGNRNGPSLTRHYQERSNVVPSNPADRNAGVQDLKACECHENLTGVGTPRDWKAGMEGLEDRDTSGNFLEVIRMGRKACIKDLEDCKQCTPLHFAAHSGHMSVCKWLLDKGVDPGKKDSLGRTALHGAAFNGHTECMALILSHNPELVDDRDKQGYCALHHAAANGHLEAVKMLVVNYDAFLNYRVNGSNLTALDFAMAAQQQDVTQFLMDTGALTIAAIQELASNTIKCNLRKWIKKRQLATMKSLLERHKMLTKEESLKHLESKSSDDEYHGKEQHPDDVNSAFQDSDLCRHENESEIVYQEGERNVCMNKEENWSMPLTFDGSSGKHSLTEEGLVSADIVPTTSDGQSRSPTNMIVDLPLCEDPEQEAKNGTKAVGTRLTQTHSRAPDSVVVGKDKEKIFKLRKDWERIARVRVKIQAAVVIQRYFRQHLENKAVKSGDVSTVLRQHQANNTVRSGDVSTSPEQNLKGKTVKTGDVSISPRQRLKSKVVKSHSVNTLSTQHVKSMAVTSVNVSTSPRQQLVSDIEPSTLQHNSAVDQRKAVKEDRKTSKRKTQLARNMMVNHLRTASPELSSSGKESTSENKERFKSCFPLLSQSESSSCVKTKSRTRCQSPGSQGTESPRSPGAELPYRSRLTTNEIVEQWLSKEADIKGKPGERLTRGVDTWRGTRSENVLKRNTNKECLSGSQSLPERTPNGRGPNPPPRAKTASGVRLRSSEQRQPTRESLIKNAYTSAAAVSYNFALDTYHPMASRRGCKQAAFPFKTSSRVRPNSMKRTRNGWVHTSRFAQAIGSSESSEKSR